MSATHKTHRLTDDEIHAIRMLRGVAPGRVVAEMYRRTQGTINAIQLGHAYRDVPFTPAEIELSRLRLIAVGGRGTKGQPGVPLMPKPTMFGVYRVLKNGELRYVSRSATANEKLAQEIAADLSRGIVILPTGRMQHVTAYPHVAKAIDTDTKQEQPLS